MRISKEGLGLGNHLIVFEALLIPNHHFCLLPTLSSPLLFPHNLQAPSSLLLHPSLTFNSFHSNTLIFDYLTKKRLAPLI
jgi:hypothetical protein